MAQGGAAHAALSRTCGIKQGIHENALATVLVVPPGSVVLVVWMPCSPQVEQSSGAGTRIAGSAEETEEAGEQGRGAPVPAGLQ